MKLTAYSYMKKAAVLLFCMVVLGSGTCIAKKYIEGDTPDESIPVGDLKTERKKAWESYKKSRAASAKSEIDRGYITYGDATMRFTVRNLGGKSTAGVPLYIALHGGGSSDTPDLNNEQWRQMQSYYVGNLTEGIYIAVRGVRDTWDTHFNPESYPLYDRLIEDCILVFGIDPNKVYLEGFSAGGDGVYAVAPRMADRFAAANMSSGHPNNVSFINMRNLPIQLQTGEFDTAYNRNTETVHYDDILNALAQSYDGYEHRTLVHHNMGHNYNDWTNKPVAVMTSPQAWRDEGSRANKKVNPFPPDYMRQFTREPLPELVLWDLSTRADRRSVESFYYLKASKNVTEGIVAVQYIPGQNDIYIDTADLNGDFSILLNEDMIDFSRPVTFHIGDKTVSLRFKTSRELLKKTTAERGDPSYQFEASVSYSDLMSR